MNQQLSSTVLVTDKAHREGLRPGLSGHAAALSELQRQFAVMQSQFASIQQECLVLRQTITEQTERLNALVMDVEAMTSHEDGGQEELPDGGTVHVASEGLVANRDMERLPLIQRIRAVVRTILPPDGIVIVVSEGNDGLLNLDDRQAWRFPQTEDGAYAGYYPASHTAAIAQLEVLRAKGGDFLLFPSTALGWLDNCVKFKQHLERYYRVVTQRNAPCLIFALRESAISDQATWQSKFAEVIAEFYRRFGRDPAILDWNTELELAARFPQHTIFSATTPASPVLPYIDKSIDIVAISSTDSLAIMEAQRVANGAVVALNCHDCGAELDITLEVEWQLEQEVIVLPTTSIIIPVYNGIEYTEACLVALQETLPHHFKGEIIVVDDASTDETPTRLKYWASQDKRLKILRNRKNAGFIASCNRGAKTAKGEILIFLNNDTLPQHGWLPPLLNIFQTCPDAGAVGGKLIYPDGRLQEAGGIIFSDGFGANFGKWDHNPDAPLYNYVREVDYCSGALLATWRSLFMELGGFDTRYRPAYYEDTDYCFSVRQKGYRVYYQPESTIIHLEGASSGNDLSSGAKRYQVINHKKFVKKWSSALQRQPVHPSRFDSTTWYALAVHDELEGAETR
jgi:GT2 family glycosyltransferase